MQSSEHQIIPLLVSGDKKAIDMIYDRYADNLYGVLVNMLKDESAAQEVLQESMIKIWKNGHRYDPKKGKLFTWLMRLTRNKAIDYIRSQKTRNEFNIQIADSNVNNNTVEIRPEIMDVPDHLNRLETKYRDVLHALFFLGMTQKEVSDKYKMPLGTVKTRLKIGLRELRKVFNETNILVSLMLFFYL